MNLFIVSFPYSDSIITGYSERLVDPMDDPVEDPKKDPGKDPVYKGSKGFNGFIFSRFGKNQPLAGIPQDFDDFDEMKFLKWICENDMIFSRKAGSSQTSQSSQLSQAPQSAQSSQLTDKEISTSKEAHIEYVEGIISALTELRKREGCTGKVVAARKAIKQTSLNPIDIFRKLIISYPDALKFLFSTPESGTWIGASPELLLEAHDREIHTISLAGTRKATDIPLDFSNMDELIWPVVTPEMDIPWDAKNIEEQRMVTDFILKELQDLNISTRMLGPFTRRAGTLEHLQTVIKGELPETSVIRRMFSSKKALVRHNYLKFIDIARELSPTPALCGYPRDFAESIISRKEPIERDYYGGIVGMADGKGGGISAFVNLRSGRYNSESKEITLYAGGGITEKSIPEEEWLETDRKLSTMSRALQ